LIKLAENIVSNFAGATSREWLETNGIGGYASGTVSGSHTRRYHGSLVAATKPPLGRAVLLSKCEETIVIDGERFEISTNQYPDTIHPEGYRLLTQFRLDPFPVWTFLLGNVIVEKKLFMIDGENSTSISWSIVDGESKYVELELRPLLAFRDHHHLRQTHFGFDERMTFEDSSVSFKPVGELPRLYISHNAQFAEASGDWYRGFEYALENERGFDFHEDLFQPCVLKFDLSTDARVICSTERHEVSRFGEFEQGEIARRKELILTARAEDEFTRQLVLAADQFIVNRGSGKTIIAGYHWFSDWGRDTMIALPGLTLATNRPDVAKSILSEFAKHISQGMIPNRFPDEGETPDYNTVDATLWFFEATRAYAAHTGDLEFVQNGLYDKLVDIVDQHIHGTRFGIHVDTDGLLYAGEPGEQLTWMDAKIGDWAVTPRTGKPVEIQALWRNALCIMSEFAAEFDDAEGTAKYASMAAVAHSSFNGQFWNADDECLYDVIDGDAKDASIRPNQIFAISLHHSMLGADHARKVVEKVEHELLTPFGLRSLSASDERYAGTYIGSPFERDSVYHQGTVWAWLIGPFVDAIRKVYPDDEKRVDRILSSFRSHMNDAMLGQVSEIFDADPAYGSRGCAAQAWSVSELLRVLTKD